MVNTSPTDYRVNKQLQMMKFNGERWELFGPILEDSGVRRRYTDCLQAHNFVMPACRQRGALRRLCPAHPVDA